MRIKKMAKKLLATILVLAMVAPYIPSVLKEVEASNQESSRQTVVESDGVKYVWYDDISPYRIKDSQEQYYTDSPKDSGYVFGGWFQNANETSSIGTETDGGAWAKFVPDEVFTVKAQISIAQPTTGVGFEDILSDVTKVNLRLVTGVDSLKYNKVVFRITHLGKTLEYPFQDVLKAIDVKADETKDFETVEPNDVFGDAAIRFATIRITGVSNAKDRYLKDWEVTPLIVTQDGTMVSGVTRDQLYIADALSNVTDGDGFEAESDEVTYTHTNKTATATPSHQYLKGGSDTVYLSGTYTTDGTGVNTFGLAIRSAGVERYVVFDGHGFKVLTDEGVDVYTQNTYTTESGEVQVWVDSGKTTVTSEVNTMLTTASATEGNVVWAISENVLYCNVAGKGAFKVPMTELCDTWVSGRTYQVGIAGYNTVDAVNSMSYKQTTFLLSEKADEQLIAPTSEIISFKKMGYDPISGAYISEYSTAGTGAATSSVSTGTALGISADIDWPASNTSGAGITIVLDGNDDKSIQYLLMKEDRARLHSSYKWSGNYITSPSSYVMTGINAAKNESGLVNIKAAVYDDKLSVLVNDTTTYQVELSELFGEDYTGEQKISIGLGTYSAYEGTPYFKNVTVYEGQDAIDMKMENWTFLVSSATADKVSYDVTKGTVSAYDYGQLQLQGTSDAWEISGTLSHGVMSEAWILHGFGISSGSNGVRVFEIAQGFNYDNETTSGYKAKVGQHKNDEYVFKTGDTTKMLVTEAVEPMTFKAMVVEDIFYFWLNDRLAWRIPVQTMNSAIEAGSEYNMALYSWLTQVEFGDVVVRTGSEIDTNFLEVMKIAKEASWRAAKDNWEMNEDGTFASYDENQDLSDWQSVSFNQYSTDIYMTGTWKKTTDTVSDFGLFVKDKNENRRSILFNGKGFVVGGNESSKIEYIELGAQGYVFGQNDKSPVYEMLNGSEQEHDVIYAITDNTLYVKVDDCIAGIIPMSALCDAWTDEVETEFCVGLTYNVQQDIEPASFADAQVKYGSDVQTYLVDETKVASNMSSTDISNMVYNPIDGAYIAKYIDGTAVMYGNASAATVGIKTDIQWLDMATSDGAVGISIKSATTGNTVEFMLRSDNKTLRKLENVKWSERVDTTLNNVTPFNSQETCQLSAVVQNGNLQLMCNGDVVYTVALSEYLNDYNNEDVILGIATNNSDEGIAYFRDIAYYTGDDAASLLPNETQEEDTNISECGLSKLENASSTIDENGLNIYRTATRDGVSVATIDGANTEWSIAGTMKQPDLGRLLPQGFIITSGEKSLKLLGDENGFVSVVNDGEWNSDNSNIGSSATYNSYFTQAERASTSVDFTFKIGNDKIYFYTTNLVWIIDLTSETYGGFAAGSDYVVSFVMEDYALEGSFEKVKIQRGSDIQKIFEVDESVGTYETTTTAISETIGTITKNSVAAETIYFDGISQTWEIRGTMTQENLMQRIRQGFAVRNPQSGTVCKFTAEDRGFLKVDSVGWKWFSVQTNNVKYILDESQTRTFARVDTESGSRQSKTIDFRVVVKDDVMFVFLNDVLSWRIPLTFENMGGFTAGSDYQLGVTWFSNENSDNAILTDTSFIISSVKFGDEADTSGIIKYVLSSASDEMVSDAVKGEISVNPTSASVRTVYFASDETDNSSTRWEISGTLTAKNIMKGFSVKSADGTKAMYVTLHQGLSLNESWKSPYTDVGWKMYEVDNQYVFDAVNDSNITYADTNIGFRVLIVDDVFYGWINDELAWKLPLTEETFGGFEAGTSYCLGLRNLDKDGSAIWSDLSVKYGTQVQTTQDIYIRDPFVLADNDTYYMYGTTKPYKGSFDVFTSKNLITWERQERCFVADDNFWGKDNFWAPEVYQYTYNGETAYYMFATFEGSDGVKGTSVLTADSPLGPFKAWSDGPLTMDGHDCIDGTLYVENGTPYMIYCHAWNCAYEGCYDPSDPTDPDKVMGSMVYVELSSNLKSTATGATHNEWFDAKYGEMYNFVTDGPFVYSNNGQKYLLWSTTDQDAESYKTMCTPFDTLGETINIGEQTTILYDEDGGHPMAFADFAGNDCLVLHTPNSGDTRAKFFSITNVENELTIAPR